MKKWLSLLLSLLMLLCAAGALAEAAPVAEEAAPGIPPVAVPAAPEELHARWQLFTQEPALELEITAMAEASGEDYVITLNGLDAWGVAAEACTSWVYDIENQLWVEDETPDVQPENAATLSIDAQYYYLNGFPGWECDGVDGSFSYQLEDYSADPNNPDYHLTCFTDNSAVMIALSGEGFTLSSFTDSAMSYCVYDETSTLTLGTYFIQKDNDDMVTYAVTPDETEGGEGYVLYYINVQTADGGNYLWTEDAWTDIEGNQVAAPEGYSADELPFVLVEE